MQCPQSLREKSYFIGARDIVCSQVCIGEGSYGEVYKGTCGRRKTECALKYIRKYLIQGASAYNFLMSRFEQECDFTQQLASPHIVKFIGVSFDDHVPVLITELMECSLTEVLECQYCSIPYHREVDIALGVARGVDYLHSQQPPIVHRDLSSNNILLASDHTVKIADLGVAKCANSSPCSPMPGTNVYMPPEVLQYSVLSVAIDLFSYAVLLIQLETRLFPNPAEKMERILPGHESDDGEEGQRERGREEGEGEEGEREGGEGKEGEGEGEGMEKGRREGGVVTENVGQSDTEREEGHVYLRTRTELERRECHIGLMDETGVFHRIVMCYLEESPRARKRTPLREVIAWLDEATHMDKYVDSVQTNPEVHTTICVCFQVYCIVHIYPIPA